MRIPSKKKATGMLLRLPKGLGYKSVIFHHFSEMKSVVKSSFVEFATQRSDCGGQPDMTTGGV